MSSRVLKKLHGDNDLEIGDQELSDGDDIGAGSKKKPFEVNRYDLVIFPFDFISSIFLFHFAMC